MELSLINISMPWTFLLKLLCLTIVLVILLCIPISSFFQVRGSHWKTWKDIVAYLNYLTITRPDLTFFISVVSQFLNAPCDSHWEAVTRILQYIKDAPGRGLLYEDKGNTKITYYSEVDWSSEYSTMVVEVVIGGKGCSVIEKGHTMAADIVMLNSLDICNN